MSGEDWKAMTPRVSICVPNLNTLPFLRERFETIFTQTFTDWELLAYDSYSEDGSWEYIQELSRREPRMHAWQGPREGTPGSWNPCIQRARGEYVYIATSDDGMAPDCIEKMVLALDERPDCDLAHCTLRVVDEKGADVDVPCWPQCSAFADVSPELAGQRHVRRAPYDGLLHLTGRMVYVSITELLIRRTLFDKIGLFSKRWGAVGDFHWDMKAGLTSNTVHVPDTWATWRVHLQQASASVPVHSLEMAQKYEEMIEDAIVASTPYLAPEILHDLQTQWLDATRDLRRYYARLRHLPRSVDRRLFQAREVLSGSRFARLEVLDRARGRQKWPERAPAEILQWIESKTRTRLVSAVS
jgi:glycosyltransferase involved in cell wall biosynthesis